MKIIRGIDSLMATWCSFGQKIGWILLQSRPSGPIDASAALVCRRNVISHNALR
jgi:hypothetical protein